jgi:hypothetical protein
MSSADKESRTCPSLWRNSSKEVQYSQDKWYLMYSHKRSMGFNSGIAAGLKMGMTLSGHCKVLAR